MKNISPTLHLENLLLETDFYRFFAFSFGLPTAERHAWLRGREFGNLFTVLQESLQGEEGFPPLTRFQSFQQYETAYIALFDVGVPQPPVPLTESAHHKTIPAQQIALDCVNFYEVLGLQHERRSFPPDHLVTQLEFLAAVRYARESSARPKTVPDLIRLEADFIERHVTVWLPAARKKLAELQPLFFPVLLQALEAFLAERLADLRRNMTE